MNRQLAAKEKQYNALIMAVGVMKLMRVNY